MVTYYAAQLGIALSVVDECSSDQAIAAQEQKSERTNQSS